MSAIVFYLFKTRRFTMSNNTKTVAGHLRVKQGFIYIVLTYKDYKDVKVTTAFSTGLKERGNKRKAEELLTLVRSNFQRPKDEKELEYEKMRMKALITGEDFEVIKASKVSFDKKYGKDSVELSKNVGLSKDMLFADFMYYWLENIEKFEVEEPTYGNYHIVITKIIMPYFYEKQIKLCDLSPIDIQTFYSESLNGFSICNKSFKAITPSTIKKRHANIRKALEFACNMDLINRNVADRVKLPKPIKYEGKVYDAKTLELLFEKIKGTRIEFAVHVAAFYGLRRGDVVGLKWSAIDFERKTIEIRHVVTEYNLNGKVVRGEKDRVKTESSVRTMPLVKPFEDLLKRMLSQREQNMKLCGDKYSKKYLEYIYVNELGERIKPGYITKVFPQTLERIGMPRIRFHDLRHSCSTLLYLNGSDLKEIQAWLGHSNITTTANIYTHFDYSKKIDSANTMLNALPTIG